MAKASVNLDDITTTEVDDDALSTFKAGETLLNFGDLTTNGDLANGIFGAANIPFVYYSVTWWRTIHPKTTVVPTLGAGMRGTFWFCVLAFMLLMVLIGAARVRLERQRARVDELFLELED